DSHLWWWPLTWGFSTRYPQGGPYIICYPEGSGEPVPRTSSSPRLQKQQKKQVEHQLEEEKKANNEKQKAERELEVQIQRLNTQKGKLNTDLYHRKCSLKNFEDESKGLAIHLQHSLQRIAELEWALSAVTTTQEKKEDSTSSRSKAVIEWQLEWSIREQALLNAHMTQLKELLKQIQLERDEYAQHIKEERAQWQQRIRKMLQEVLTLKKEKKHETCRGKKLERSLSKLKNQMAEPLPPEPPAVPSEVELQHLRKEVDRVAEELKAQNNENKSTLQLEQQVKELQEKLGKVELKSQEAQSLQQHPITWVTCSSTWPPIRSRWLPISS
uniref:Golgin subfamily A conserved domain-containing protein n=1 Tax=Pongo abelii TaxID=9601 RepID=H2NPC8_PONAB